MKSFKVCRHCGREVVPRSSPLWREGMIPASSNTLCRPCEGRVRHGVPLPGHDYRCAECGTWVDTSYDGGGVKPAAGGVCKPCRIGRATSVAKTAKAPKECVDCGAVLVPQGHARGPGERHHYARSLCRPCYRRRARSEPFDPNKVTVTRRMVVPEACLGCKTPMVPKRKPVGEGQKRHKGRGLCSTCYGARRRTGHLDTPEPPVLVPDEVRGMMAARAARKARAAAADRARAYEYARRMHYKHAA